jgi:hypothetical protein
MLEFPLLADPPARQSPAPRCGRGVSSKAKMIITQFWDEKQAVSRPKLNGQNA